MLDKECFTDMLNILEYYTCGLDKFETALNVTLDNNFMTEIIDQTLCVLANSFFTEEQREDLENQVTIETVKDIIYHYAFRGEFGLKVAELQRLYVEDENTSNEFVCNAFNGDELYDLINRYLHPQKLCKTYTLHC